MRRERTVRSAWKQWRDGLAATWQDYREWYQTDRQGGRVSVIVLLFTVVAMTILIIARLSEGWYLAAIIVVAVIAQGVQVIAYRRRKRGGEHSRR